MSKRMLGVLILTIHFGILQHLLGSTLYHKKRILATLIQAGHAVLLINQPGIEKNQRLITKVVSKGSWISSGTDVSKHALCINITSELAPLPFLKTMCSYEGTFSTTTVCNYMTLKGALSF